MELCTTTLSKNNMKKIILSSLFAAGSLLATAQVCEHGCGSHSENDHVKITHTPFQKYKGLSNHFIGSTHQHSIFSDGSPGTTPADYYGTGKTNGYDFVFGSDHSDGFIIPVGLHEDCASEQLIDCITIDPMAPTDGILKWATTKRMAEEATVANEFLAVRGFEWTSDRTGHINVYFTKNITNAKTDGGYVDISLFYNWLSTEPLTIPLLDELTGGLGGADGLAVFNHPGDKKLAEEDPAYNWNNFAFSEKAEPFMVGMEVFNGGSDYASDGRAFFQEALDKGWHIGAIASEDHHGTDWNNASDPKTVFIATELTETGMKQAMRDRSFYAVRDHGLRMEFTTGTGSPMGSQLSRKTGSVVTLIAEVTSINVTKLELVSITGRIVATVEGTRFRINVDVLEAEQYYYLRAADSTNRTMAYSSPIWIKGGGDIDEATGIASHAVDQLQVFPNPVKDVLFITNKDGNAFDISILNATGEVVLIQHFTEAHNQINIESFPKGLYFIQMKSGSGVNVQKVVKD